jgi:hypothetical protein
MMKQLLVKSNMASSTMSYVVNGPHFFFTIKMYIIIFMSRLHNKYAKNKIDIYRFILDEYVNIIGM